MRECLLNSSWDDDAFEPYQAIAFFMPQCQAQRLNAACQIQGRDRHQDGDCIVGLFQPVVRHPRIEVVDMVKSDVARKPLQYPRQAQEGRTIQRRSGGIPFRLPAP
jgi:hypothetical protein